ncbi:MAG: hypothetical protein Q8P67_09700 [archaeon]|nr:hypothetical protein [archaeon]
MSSPVTCRKSIHRLALHVSAPLLLLECLTLEALKSHGPMVLN